MCPSDSSSLLLSDTSPLLAECVLCCARIAAATAACFPMPCVGRAVDVKRGALSGGAVVSTVGMSGVARFFPFLVS